MNLSELMVDSKSAWIEYPDFPGFEVELVYLARKEMQALRKRCVTEKFDRTTRQKEEKLNEKKFIEEFANAVIKDWKGLTLGIVEQLILIDRKGAPADTPLDYTPENAVALMSGSTDFDTWINDTVFDLENFRS